MENNIDSQGSAPLSETTTIDTPVVSSPLKFHGKGQDFFKIWIVNLLLTIVTLGIYSAWAKVRTNRYLYSNLEMGGHRFSYLAQPMQILKGRIIGLLLFGSYFLLSSVSPFAALALVLVMLSATPFLIVMSIRFNMKMTGYRNIRFGFDGSVGRAFKVYSLLPVLSIFTLYLAMPWVLKKMDEYLYSNMRFGQKTFHTKLKTAEYYEAASGSIILSIPFLFLVGYSAYDILPNPEDNAQAMESTFFSFASILPILAYALLYLVSSSFYQTKIRNHIFANTDVQDVAKLQSNASVIPLMNLKLTNFLAIVFSLGLAMPWAKIRTARYWSDVTSVAILPGADDILAGEKDTIGAIGDEVADVFDIDIAIG